jgi:hypothetical protein
MNRDPEEPSMNPTIACDSLSARYQPGDVASMHGAINGGFAV